MTSKATVRAPTASVRSRLIAGLLTSLVTLLIVEGVGRWMFRTPYQWERRLMFFSEGHNLRNTAWGGFVYQPHERVHARTYYLTNLDPPEPRIEYDYHFTTNAYGLVQRNELADSKPAMLLLGDSFTEGQGAQPWFYGLEHDWPPNSPYQIVNGGIWGTGVEAWARLYQELSTQVKIAKVVILFISDDWARFVWQFSPRALECLKAAAQCKGSEEYYGLSEDPIEAQREVSRIAQYRADYLLRLQSGTNVISRSAVYQYLVMPQFDRLTRFRRTGSFEDRDSRQFEINKGVATRMVTELGRDNVLFMYLPQKDELVTGPKSLGRRANDFIRESGFRFVDGRAQCGLSIQNFHERDGHPNESGYAKIATCVRRAIDDAFHPAR